MDQASKWNSLFAIAGSESICIPYNRGPKMSLLIPGTEKALEKIRQADNNPEVEYWIAEVGPESEAWRWLAPAK